MRPYWLFGQTAARKGLPTLTTGGPFYFEGQVVSALPYFASSDRRFPPLWTVDEHTDSFCVKDATGWSLAASISRTKKDRRDARDEARRIAIATPPGRLQIAETRI
jgi:hypothetical protein